MIDTDHTDLQLQDGSGYLGVLRSGNSPDTFVENETNNKSPNLSLQLGSTWVHWLGWVLTPQPGRSSAQCSGLAWLGVDQLAFTQQSFITSYSVY